MKKLAIDLGGHQITAQNTLWVQTGLTEGILATIKALGGPFCIVDGIEFTHAGTVLTWTAGWVYFNNELFQVDAGTSDLGVGAIVNGSFSVVETYDAVGDVVYKDLSTVHTQVIRKASFVAGTGTSDPLFHRSAVRLKNRSNYYVNSQLAMLGSWFVTGSSGSTVLLGSLSVDGQVRLSLSAKVNSYNGTTDPKICTLPASLRPAYDVIVLAPMITGGSTRTFVQILIEADGDVIPQGLSASTMYEIFFDGVSFVRNTVFSN